MRQSTFARRVLIALQVAGWRIERAAGEPYGSLAQAMGAIKSVDDARVYVRHPEHGTGWLRFIWQGPDTSTTDGEEILADWGGPRPAFDHMNAIIEAQYPDAIKRPVTAPEAPKVGRPLTVRLDVEKELLPTAFIAIGPNCWGKGETVDVAAKNARANLPGPSYLKPGPVPCIIYSVKGFTHVDDMGRIWYATGGGVTEVARKTWRVSR